MTRHIVYLNDQFPICEDPDRLGKDLVVSDATFGNSCGNCNALLHTFNKNEFAKEYNIRYIPPAVKTPNQVLAGAYPWALVVILAILLILEVLR